MAYTAPVRDFKFLLTHVVGLDRVAATERFTDATPETVAAVLEGAGRLATDILAPLQRVGDTDPARLDGGRVRVPAGFADGYRAIADGGWIGLSAPVAHGGTGLPHALSTALHEMMSGACLSLQLCPLLTQGAIKALTAHGDDHLQELYLPRLIAGEWSAAMAMTEPQAGSDIGAAATKAVPNDDGTHAITGAKIYTSWGDHDMGGLVCHLVLARLPDAPEGSRGLSLFLVPTRLPDGTANRVTVTGLETKLGLHGAPTCAVAYDGATGWLVGQPNGGLRAMFTMMNDARLGVGVQGVGVAEAACQLATAHAIDRRQGRTATGEVGIIGHPDVRRMLATMRAEVTAARALTLDCAVALDLAATGDAAAQARADLLTPIAKAFGSDTGIAVADRAMQVLGGMGVIEAAGAAQLARDVRVTAIYEGTNGIQAMDLAGRKLADGGAAATALIDEIAAEAGTARATLPDLAASVAQGAEALRDATDWMVAQTDMADRFAGAAPYLRGMALVLGSLYHLRAAMADGGTGQHTACARVYMARCLPEHATALAAATLGADDLMAVRTEDLTR